MHNRKVVILFLVSISLNSMFTITTAQFASQFAQGGIKKFYKYAALALLAGGLRGSGIGKGLGQKVVKMVTGQKDSGAESTKQSPKYAQAPAAMLLGQQGLGQGLGGFGSQYGAGLGGSVPGMGGSFGNYGMGGMGAGLGGSYSDMSSLSGMSGMGSMGSMGSMSGMSGMGGYGGIDTSSLGGAYSGGMGSYDSMGMGSSGQGGMVGGGYGDLGGYGGIGHNLGGFNYGNTI